jgi:hypothetical protein
MSFDSSCEVLARIFLHDFYAGHLGTPPQFEQQAAELAQVIQNAAENWLDTLPKVSGK